MKISSSCILLLMVANVTFTSCSFISAGGKNYNDEDHQSVNLLSIRNGKNSNALPSSFLQQLQDSSHGALIKRESSSKKHKKKTKKQRKDDEDEDEEEEQKQSKKKKNKKSTKSEKKKGGKGKKSDSGSCKDRTCPLLMKPCPKDCPQSCGYLNSPDPCCPLLGTPTCPDY